MSLSMENVAHDSPRLKEIEGMILQHNDMFWRATWVLQRIEERHDAAAVNKSTVLIMLLHQRLGYVSNLAGRTDNAVGPGDSTNVDPSDLSGSSRSRRS